MSWKILYFKPRRKGLYGGCQEQGYTKQQSLYAKGYNPPISHFTRFAAIIINDIDDLVHGQKQGRVGMYNDVSLLAKSGKLQTLIQDLYSQGFNIYITSDHGNTPASEQELSAMLESRWKPDPRGCLY